jgi:hypothetical protein
MINTLATGVNTESKQIISENKINVATSVSIMNYDD